MYFNWSSTLNKRWVKNIFWLHLVGDPEITKMEKSGWKEAEF